METEIIGSSLDDRYWFRARIVACRESYRQLYGVPASINPWAIRAQSRLRRYEPEWNGWTPTDAGILIDLLCQQKDVENVDGRYERILEYVVCVVAENRSQAHSRANTCLKNGSFEQFDIEDVDTDEASTLAATSAATDVLADQTAVHPLIGGEYTPPVPEIHLAGSTENIAGLIRLELSRAQLREQIARVQEHRQRVYDWGRFKLAFALEQPTHERLLAILSAIADADEGALVASVPLTEDEPEVAVALALDMEWVDQIQERAGGRALDGASAQWKIPLPESSLDPFLDRADMAVSTDTPHVIGPSPFIDRDDTTDVEMIAATR